MTVSPLDRGARSATFDEFYRNYFVRVLVLVRRHFPGCDAEEIAQETMARCYTSFDSLDPHRDPWPWISSVARNAAIDSLRRTKRNVSADELPEMAYPGDDATYDAVLVLERRHSVRTALHRLRPADRQLLEDHELEGMGYTEMAALRDITPNALRQKLFRARGRLAVELRRVGASLGLVPAAIENRFGRLFRKANDVTYAIGPVGASALSVAAVTGVAAVATMVGTLTPTPVTTAAGRPAFEAVAPAERTVVRPAVAAPPAPTTARVAPRGPAPNVPPPTQPPIPVVNVEANRYGDPVSKPNEYQGETIRIPTPVGDYEYYVDRSHTPGWGVVCYLGLDDCPWSEESENPERPQG